MVFKIFLIFLTCFNLFAYTPTVEGLFRNGSNQDISKDLLMLQLEVSKPDALETKKRFVKLLFFPEDEQLHLIQVEYASDSMRAGEILSVKSLQNYEEILASPNPTPSLFYAILTSLVMNRAGEMDLLLRKIAPEYQSAKSTMNEEKLELLSRYKAYLETEEEKRDELENPFKPQDPEEIERVKKIKSEPFYRPSSKVSLEREGYSFLWKVDFQSFKALFNHKNHTLKSLEAYLTDQWVKMTFAPHVLFNGIHQMPSSIEVDLAEKGKFQIKTLRLVHINSNGKGFERRKSEYLKLDQKSSLETPEAWPFLL